MHAPAGMGERSRHDDLVVEAACGNDQEKGADSKKSEAVKPKMSNASAAEDHAASDVDEVARRDEVADDVEDFGHGFARENVAGEEDAGQDGQKGQLHGFRLGVGPTGN